MDAIFLRVVTTRQFSYQISARGILCETEHDFLSFAYALSRGFLSATVTTQAV
jgi:hypothetical protein